METKTVKLGSGLDLVLTLPPDEPLADQALILASIIRQALPGMTELVPSIQTGSLPIKLGSTMYRVHYKLRIKRMMNALTVYSEAIRYIEVNIHRYDPYLAQVAIETLRECHRKLLASSLPGDPTTEPSPPQSSSEVEK